MFIVLLPWTEMCKTLQYSVLWHLSVYFLETINKIVHGYIFTGQDYYTAIVNYSNIY